MLPEHSALQSETTSRTKSCIAAKSFPPFSSSQLPRLFYTHSPSSREKKAATTRSDGFVPVYRFPYVAPAVLFTKFKIAQTAGVTMLLAPYYVYQVTYIRQYTYLYHMG